jgi:hypothetical protein
MPPELEIAALIEAIAAVSGIRLAPPEAAAVALALGRMRDAVSEAMSPPDFDLAAERFEWLLENDRGGVSGG